MRLRKVGEETVRDWRKARSILRGGPGTTKVTFRQCTEQGGERAESPKKRTQTERQEEREEEPMETNNTNNWRWKIRKMAEARATVLFWDDTGRTHNRNSNPWTWYEYAERKAR